MFRMQNLCPGTKMFLTSGKSIFCFRAAKFVSATHVYWAAKMGNICISNNVSKFSQAFIIISKLI